MGFPAFLDTNVIYGAVLADTFLRVAEAGAYRPHWSPGVLTELSRNLVKHARLSPEKAERRVKQMDAAFSNASITGYEGLIEGLLCDPKDRHVLAAAIHGHCQVIVTFNTKDFPPASVSEYGITVVHPDEFLLDQLDLHPHLVEEALFTQAATARRPEVSYAELLARLQRAGVGAFVGETRHRFGKGSDEGRRLGRRFQMP